MIEEPLKEQASLYAIGGLPESKARDFEHVMQSNLELQLLVTQMRQSLDLMVVSLPRRAPSPALKAKIMRRIGGRKPGVAVLVPSGVGGTPFWMAIFPWAVAACLTCLCALQLSRSQSERERLVQLEQRLTELASQNGKLEASLEAQKVEHARQKQALSAMVIRQSSDQNRSFMATTNQLVERIRVMEKRAADVVAGKRPVSSLLPAAAKGTNEEEENEIVGAPRSIEAGGVSPVPGGVLSAGGNRPADAKTSFLGILRSVDTGSTSLGAVTWDALLQKGTVVVEQLPAPDADHDYQLWLIQGGNPVSGGLLRFDSAGHVSNGFTLAERLESVQTFAISRERKGGVSEVPQGPVIMVANNN